MKKISLHIIATLTTAILCAQPVLLYNDGASMHVKNGAVMIVNDGSATNNTGLITNAGRVIIEGNFVNNATATGAGVGTGVYEVKQNWENNATYTADQGMVKLNGPNNQLITGSQISNFYNLTLDSGFVKTQTLDAFTHNNLQLNDAELATDVFRMTVTNTNLNAVGRSTGFVSSLGVGQFVRNTAGTGYYMFPLGSSVGTTRYRPVFIAPTDNNPNEYGGRLANTDATAESYDRNVKENDICLINPLFYHRLYQNNGTSAANIRISYDPSTDNAYEGLAQWRNLPQWEKIAVVTDGVWLGQTYKQLLNWTNFNSSAFAFNNLLPTIDTSNMQIVAEYCGPNGLIRNIVVNNLMPNTQYTWSQGGNVIQTGTTTGSSQTLPILPNLLTGTYTLTITKPNGCGASMTVNVGFDPTYTTSIVPTHVRCWGQKNGSADLTVNGGFSPFTYLWSNTTTNQDLANVGAGWHYVTVRDDKGCIVRDSVLITQPPRLVVETDFTPETCERADGTASALASGGTPFYTYTWNTVPELYGTNISSLVAGNYDVLVEDANGCKTSKTVKVHNIPSPIAEFTSDPLPGEAVTLSNARFKFTNLSTGAVAYSWNFGDDNTSNAINPWHQYYETGEYVVALTAYNQLGCQSIYYLSPYLIVPDGQLYIPNVFTPNGDGKNDEFYADGEGVASFNMVIFDRWGKLVTMLNNISERWDGKVNGMDVPEGTYTFVVDYRLNSGAFKKMGGTINLIR